MARIKTRLVSEKAKDQTRRKILTGALIFEEYKVEKMDSFLKKNHDRELFNLPINNLN